MAYITVREAAMMLINQNVLKEDPSDPVQLIKAEAFVRRHLKLGDILGEPPTRRARGTVPDAKWRVDECALDIWIKIHEEPIHKLRRGVINGIQQVKRLKSENDKLRSRLAELESETSLFYQTV